MRIIFNAEERLSARTIVNLATPISIGIVLAVGLNLINALYISILGETSLAAIAFALPVMLALSHAFIGFGTGLTSQCASLLGAGRKLNAAEAAFQGVIAAALIGIIVGMLGAATAKPFFRFMGANDQQLTLLLPFIRIWYTTCVPGLAVMMSCSAALRATGDTKTPSKILAAVALANGALDPVLIFGYGPIPALGPAGAACASAMAICAGAVYSGMTLCQKYNWPLIPSKNAGANLKLIFYVGFPAIFSQMLPGAAQAIVTFYLAKSGSEAMAGYALASRAETLFLVPFMGLSAACTIIAARMRGAANATELYTLARASQETCLIAGLILSAILILITPSLTTWSSPSQGSAEVARLYLYITPISLISVGAGMCAAAIMNALLKPYSALAVYLVRCAFALLPAAAIGSAIWGTAGVFAAVAFANLFALPVAWFTLHRSLPERISDEKLLSSAENPLSVASHKDAV